MLRVVIESPYSGKNETEILGNITYARACVRDSLLRGEAPIASHLLHTQPDILRDSVPEERKLGMAAGHAWIEIADLVVFYIDRGISSGMEEGLKEAQKWNVPTENRNLFDQPSESPKSPKPESLIFQPGKFYKIRSGAIVQLVSICDNRSWPYLIVEWIKLEDGSPSPTGHRVTLCPDGKYLSQDVESPHDIVSIVE